MSFTYYPDTDRLMNVADGAHSVTYFWDAGGEAIASVLDTQVHEERCYDGPGRLKAIVAVPSSASLPSCVEWPPAEAIAAFRYTYDARGNRTEQSYAREFYGSAVVESTTYGYDDADRLTGVRYEDGSAELYKLGPDGARVDAKRFTDYDGGLGPDAFASSQQPGIFEHLSEYVFGQEGQLATEYRTDPFDVKGEHRSWEWDGAGRLKAVWAPGPTPTKLHEYAWDAADRLREATTAGGTVRYGYEADGLRRMRKWSPSPLPDGTTPPDEETAYLWRPGSLYAETQVGSGTPLVYAGLGEAAYAGEARVIRDGLRSPVVLVGAGGVENRWRFGAWGEYRPDDSASPAHEPAPAAGVSTAFTGHAWDGAAELVYAQQRWYDPSVGRFLSRDPAPGRLDVPATLNPYVYAAANPTTYVDPDGASPTLVTAGAGAVLGAGFGAISGCLAAADADGEWSGCGGGAGQGAIEGAIAGGAGGLVGGAVFGAMGGGAAGATFGRTFLATATSEAAGGATAGAVSALQQGGDVLEGAGRGFVLGAAGGVIGGAVAGGGLQLAGLRTGARLSRVAAWGMGGVASDAGAQATALALGWQDRYYGWRSVAGGVVGAGMGVILRDPLVSRGGYGTWSRRTFDPDAAGGPIRSLNTEGVRITERGIDVVEGHLARFGPDAANEGMVLRLRDVAGGRMAPEPVDLNFYTHELREFVRYRQLGFRTGAGGNYELWNNAHTATLADYRLESHVGLLYHPSVLR